MQSNDDVYRTPKASLEIEKVIPEAFSKSVLTVGKLRFLAWLSIFYLLMSILIIGVEVMVGLDAGNTMYQRLSEALSLIDTVIEIYLLLALKTFLNTRFEYFRANTEIYILIVLSILITVLSYGMEAAEEGSAVPFTMVFFGVVAISGVISIIFGIKLVRLGEDYRGLKLYSWSVLLSGIAMASVVLLLLAVPLSLLNDIALAMMFFAAAKERLAADTGVI